MRDGDRDREREKKEGEGSGGTMDVHIGKDAIKR